MIYFTLHSSSKHFFGYCNQTPVKAIPVFNRKWFIFRRKSSSSTFSTFSVQVAKTLPSGSEPINKFTIDTKPSSRIYGMKSEIHFYLSTSSSSYLFEALGETCGAHSTKTKVYNGFCEPLRGHRGSYEYIPTFCHNWKVAPILSDDNNARREN